jgi:hypothetical protein
MPTWFDSTAARKRLSQVDGEVQKLQAEHALIEQLLGLGAARQAGAATRRGRPPKASRQRRGRPPKARRGRPPGAAKGPTLIDLVVEALKAGSPAGRTVAEIIAHVAKSHPDRVASKGTSASLSAAIAQARKAKKPKIKVVKQGGPGVPSRYGPA